VKFSRRDFLAAGALAIGSSSMAGIGRVFARQGSEAVFRHGVASGDPLRDRVVIWTRVTPGSPGEVVDVGWMIARDNRMSRPVASGSVRTSAERDYTVKLDAVALEPGATYYYRFSARGARSPVGRTRTLPPRPTRRVRLAVVSCANLPFGYFNVYSRIAARTDLNAVLHLGDYIYEYANGQYGRSDPSTSSASPRAQSSGEGDGRALDRVPFPDREIVSLDDYRARYAQYREDADLQAAHRQHPFIPVWDDHEFANDAWRDGAENHQPAEGSWSTRKAAAMRAWREWMPVRDVPAGAAYRLYRQFAFGDMADLMMLDTRIEGRDIQALRTDTGAIARASRQLLGSAQEEWLLENLRDSTAAGKPWQILGQQVMFSPQSPTGTATPNADSWDGYRAARHRVLEAAAASGVKNLVVLTGDMHSSWAYDIAPEPFNVKRYDPATGRGAVGTEIVAPAVTSPSGLTDAQVAKILPSRPHLKYVAGGYRGYVVLELTREQLQADWWSVPTILERTTTEQFEQGLVSAAGQPGLTRAVSPTSPIEFV
jgi:alkaline phosphatase D